MSYARLIYDDIDIKDASAAGGGYVNNSGNWVATGNASASNPIRLIDNKIHKSCLISGSAQELTQYKSGVKITCDEIKSVSTLIFSLGSTFSNVLVRLYASNSLNTGYDTILSVGSSVLGLNVAEFNSIDKMYYVFQLESPNQLSNHAINTILIGNQYVFTHRFRAGAQRPNDIPVINESPAPGINYTTQVGDEIEEWHDSIGGMTLAEMNAAKAFKSKVKGTQKSFVFSESALDGPLHWVRNLSGSFEPKNNGGRWSMPVKFQQQLV